MENFKKGDVVRFKSGGPRMTILAINGSEITCQWFDDKKIVQSQEFEPEQLMKEDDKPRRVIHKSNFD